MGICHLFQQAPPSGLVVGTKHEHLLRIFPVPKDARSFKPKVDHPAHRTFDRATAAVRVILEHIDEPTGPPVISPARGPPAWEDARPGLDPGYDPIAQPEPEVEFDQRVQW